VYTRNLVSMLRMSGAIQPLLILLRGLHKDRNTFTFSNVRYPSPSVGLHDSTK